MKKQALLFRFKRYMAKKNWRMVQIGYSSGFVSGVLNGLSLMILLPTIVSLAEGRPAFGLSFWNWMLILLVVGVLSIVLDFVGQRYSYIGGLGFMNDVHQKVGDKISKLPLGTFKADSAGKLSRMVTAEMMNLSASVANFLYKNFNIIASLVIIALLSWLWDYRLGLLRSIKPT